MSPSNVDRKMERLASSTSPLHLQRSSASKNELEVNVINAATLLNTNRPNLSKRSNGSLPPPSAEMDSMSMNGNYHSTFESSTSTSQIPSYRRAQSSYLTSPMTINHQHQHQHSNTNTKSQQQQQQQQLSLIHI